MKKIIFICLIVCPLIGLAQDTFRISGKIEGLGSEAKIFINYVAGDERKIDSFKVKNGEFKIKGRAVLPTTAQLRLRHSNMPLSDDPVLRTPLDILSVYIDKDEIIIASPDSLKKASISNSQINADFKDLESRFTDIKRTSLALRTKLYELENESSKDIGKIEIIKDRLDSLESVRVNIYLDFAKAKNTSYIGLVALSGAVVEDLEPSIVLPIFKSFSGFHRSSILGKQIYANIERTQRTAIGEIVDFQQTDAEGKMIKLSDFRGKYVLVDFWASWCLPCREENPNLVKAYDKFSKRNFEIIGVSLDRSDSKEQWLAAIKDDNLAWPQLSDLQFWNNAVVKQFDIANIPFNILVNPEGRIIAKNLKGKYLQQKLEKIFYDAEDLN